MNTRISKLSMLSVALLLSLHTIYANNFYQQENWTTRSDSIQGKGLFYNEASYTGDFAGNLTGGKKTGTMYLGMANIEMGFETGNLGLWQGGQLHIHGVATHGNLPSENLIGDFQVASNIEAGNHTYIQELWYRQSFENLDLTLGLQDLNSEFIVSEYAGTFMNSSFGVPSVISDNIPLPIFPLTALGLTCRIQVSETFALQAALFDGMPEPFDNNQYNLNWKISRDNGGLAFAELQFSIRLHGLPGKCKAGGYYHSALKSEDENTGNIETVFKNNYGFYLLFDQELWNKAANKTIGMFAQIAVSPAVINTHNYYFGCGFNYCIISKAGMENMLGLALAHAGFSSSQLRDETTIELFFKTSINENFFLQPDIQYIINPAGGDEKLNNALAAFLRFGINF